jgi:hypothetical protein
MKKLLRKIGFKFSMLRNRTVLLRICNLPPEGMATLTHDEEKLLKPLSNTLSLLRLPRVTVKRYTALRALKK